MNTLKVDWRFTKDGDLELGSPKTNEDGELLYVTVDGVETTDETLGVLIRDIPHHVSHNVDRQVISNRLLTEDLEWYHHPEIGPSLSQLKGEPNTRETGNKGIELITECLTKDGFIKEEDLLVRATPINLNTILFYITVNRGNVQINLAIGYELNHGILTEYEVGEE